MHESRLHEGKQADIPKPRERNSFRRAVRPIKSAVQKDSRHNENSDLIALRFPAFLHLIAPEEIPARFFWFRCASSFGISLSYYETANQFDTVALTSLKGFFKQIGKTPASFV